MIFSPDEFTLFEKKKKKSADNVYLSQNYDIQLRILMLHEYVGKSVSFQIKQTPCKSSKHFLRNKDLNYKKKERKS